MEEESDAMKWRKVYVWLKAAMVCDCLETQEEESDDDPEPEPTPEEPPVEPEATAAVVVDVELDEFVVVGELV